MYNFDKQDTKTMHKRLGQLSEKYETLRKNTNMKVMNTLDSTEKREQQLKQNMHTVLKDKRKIEETIAELDKYKREALESTWKAVNKYTLELTIGNLERFLESSWTTIPVS